MKYLRNIYILNLYSKFIGFSWLPKMLRKKKRFKRLKTFKRFTDLRYSSPISFMFLFESIIYQ